jgi:hypothetical protein
MTEANERDRGDAYSVGVDGPVGDELRQHRSEEAEERAGGTDGDAIPDEEHGEHAAAEARHEVHQPHPPCRTNDGDECRSETAFVKQRNAGIAEW